MKLKLFQLNMERGRFIDQVIGYIKTHDFDVVQLQEVTSGGFSYGNIDCYQALQSALDFQGEVAPFEIIRNDPGSYFANATLYHKKLKLIGKTIIELKKQQILVSPDAHDPQRASRNCLALTFQIDTKIIDFYNAHLAWGPTSEDQDYKLKQARILFDYIKKRRSSFVLSGDFNLVPDSQVVTWFDSIARNLTVENNITNTLNPATHKARHLFPPGLAVDYIYVEKSLKTNSFRLIDNPVLSDHFGLTAEIQI